MYAPGPAAPAPGEVPPAYAAREATLRDSAKKGPALEVRPSPPATPAPPAPPPPPRHTPPKPKPHKDKVQLIHNQILNFHT